jgi:predicted DCC family thiol-disulfide oxidoreductase YuxK
LRPRTPEVEFLSFRDPGVLARFPQVTAEQCERAMQYVDPQGGVYAGAEAFVQALGHKPLWKWTYAYYVPGIRQISEAAYRWIARNRFRFGRSATCNLSGPSNK